MLQLGRGGTKTPKYNLQLRAGLALTLHRAAQSLLQSSGDKALWKPVVWKSWEVALAAKGHCQLGAATCSATDLTVLNSPNQTCPVTQEEWPSLQSALRHRFVPKGRKHSSSEKTNKQQKVPRGLCHVWKRSVQVGEQGGGWGQRRAQALR